MGAHFESSCVDSRPESDAYRGGQLQTMDIEWIDPGPKVTPSTLEIFEERFGWEIAPDLRWLLLNVVNGGSPSLRLIFPIEGLEGDDRMALHGVCGIGHPQDCYDLESSFEEFRKVLPFVQPFAYDPLDGHLFVKTGLEPRGEICYMPWDQKDDPFPENLYRVAGSMGEFLQALREDPAH